MYCDQCQREVSTSKNPHTGQLQCAQCGTVQAAEASLSQPTIAQTAHALLKRWEESRPQTKPAEQPTATTKQTTHKSAPLIQERDLPPSTASGIDISAYLADFDQQESLLAPELDEEPLLLESPQDREHISAPVSRSLDSVAENRSSPRTQFQSDQHSDSTYELARQAIDAAADWSAQPGTTSERTVISSPRSQRTPVVAESSPPVLTNASAISHSVERQSAGVDPATVPAARTSRAVEPRQPVAPSAVNTETPAFAEGTERTPGTSPQTLPRQRTDDNSSRASSNDEGILLGASQSTSAPRPLTAQDVESSRVVQPGEAFSAMSAAPETPAPVASPAELRPVERKATAQGQVRFQTPEHIEDFDIQQAIERHHRKQRNWSALLGQLLAFSGALAMTGGIAIVIGNRFGSLELAETTGWLSLAGGHLLFILGIYTHLTSRCEQTWNDLHQRSDDLMRLLLQQQQAQQLLLQQMQRPLPTTPSRSPEKEARETFQRQTTAATF